MAATSDRNRTLVRFIILSLPLGRSRRWQRLPAGSRWISTRRSRGRPIANATRHPGRDCRAWARLVPPSTSEPFDARRTGVGPRKWLRAWRLQRPSTHTWVPRQEKLAAIPTSADPHMLAAGPECWSGSGGPTRPTGAERTMRAPRRSATRPGPGGLMFPTSNSGTTLEVDMTTRPASGHEAAR
jgi:hypothetical protein